MAYDLCSSQQCNVCLLLPDKGKPKKNPGHLSKCSGCFMVVYCGKEHQKRDWPLHRNLCRAIQNILKIRNCSHPFELEKKPTCFGDLESSIVLLKHLLRLTLRRELSFYEEELTSFPAYCAVCFSFRNLRRTCTHCYAVSYCNEEHERTHADLHRHTCSLLQIYYSQYKVAYSQQKSPHFNGFLSRVPKLQNVDLIDALQYSTKEVLPTNPVADLTSFQRFSFAADFSSMATICYALEHVNMSSYDNSQFRIFVVGATVEESLWFQNVHTRFFFLQYPKIECLSIYYIGPEIDQDDGSHSNKFLFLGKKRTVNHIRHKGLFQDFVFKSMVFPSLIVAFNCGFSEKPALPKIVSDNLEQPKYTPYSTWTIGLREILLTHDVPLLFTSFTRAEAEADFAELLTIVDSIRHLCIGISRILKLSQNPYRDLRPLRNWEISDSETIFYRNGYVQLVKTEVMK